MNRQNRKQRFDNLRLVNVDDPFYQVYLSQYKTEKKTDVVYDKPVPLKSDIMGYLLELAIMEWVKSSGIYMTEKVIAYEYGKGEQHSKKFKELDYVLRKGKNYFVGEVKVSSLSNGMVSKACKQLTFSKALLSQIADSVTMQIIRIDLNFKNAKVPLDEFHSDFLKAKFRDYVWEGIKFKLLHLSAQDVFNYGIENKIIKSQEIFEPAVCETDLLYSKRQSQDELKKQKKLLLETTDISETKNIQSEISQLEQKIFKDNININLSQQGWILLNNCSADDFNIILNHVDNNIEHEIKTDTSCLNTNGFSTDDQAIRFISFYCQSGETEINLLDAERVYLRLSSEQQSQLQTIKFVASKSFQTREESYPLFNKFPYRKFHYSNNLIDESEKENKSVLQFEHVIRNSHPNKITLKPNDILIFDNHRVLHRIENINSHNLTKRVILDLKAGQPLTKRLNEI